MRAVVFKNGRSALSGFDRELDPVWKEAENSGVGRDTLVTRILKTLDAVDKGAIVSAALSDNRVSEDALDAFVNGAADYYARYAPTETPSFEKFMDWAYAQPYSGAYTEIAFIDVIFSTGIDVEYRTDASDDKASLIGKLGHELYDALIADIVLALGSSE